MPFKIPMVEDRTQGYNLIEIIAQLRCAIDCVRGMQDLISQLQCIGSTIEVQINMTIHPILNLITITFHFSSFSTTFSSQQLDKGHLQFILRIVTQAGPTYLLILRCPDRFLHLIPFLNRNVCFVCPQAITILSGWKMVIPCIFHQHSQSSINYHMENQYRLHFKTNNNLKQNQQKQTYNFLSKLGKRTYQATMTVTIKSALLFRLPCAQTNINYQADLVIHATQSV